MIRLMPYIHYQEPMAESAKFTDTGAGLMVEFDSGVDYEDFSSCSDIFSNSADLGTGAACKWRTPTDLYIVIGKGSGLIEIGDTLDFKDNAVYAFRQDYSIAASGSVVVDSPDNALEPYPVITGSAYLPSCGDVVLSGIKSGGGGGRDMMYEWSVSSTGATIDVQSTLASLNSANSGDGTAVLEVDGDDLDADTDYTFTLNVTNFLGGWREDDFTVERSSAAAPQVNVLPQGVDPSYVLVSDSFSITAEVTFYFACVPAGETVFEWSCNDTTVPLNLKTQYSRTLYVPENSLPGGEPLEFTVKVYKSSDSSTYTEQSVVVTTVKSALVAIISGASEYSVGRDSGTVTIDGSLTYDPDEEARDWVYSFRCIQSTDNSACWSYDPNHIEELIINNTNINGAVLSFDTLGFQADKTYEITLVARKQERTASASVIISAVEGNPPKIVFDELQDDGYVKDTDVIFLTAKIYEADVDDTLTWTTVGTSEGYGFIGLTDSSNLLSGFPRVVDASGAGYSIAMLGIAGGVAERATSYAFRLSATNDAGQTGTAKAFIIVRSGPTSCDFSVDDYTALSDATGLVENCVSVTNSLPLTFQLFTDKADGTMVSVTDALSEPSMTFVGKNAHTGSSRTYTMEVCNKYRICSFYSDSATVTAKTSFTTAEKDAYTESQVDEPTYKGDYLTAFGNLGLLADIENASRRKRDASRVRRVASETTTETAGNQLDLIELALDEMVLTTTSAQLLIDNTISIDVTDMTIQDQDELLDYYAELIAVFTDAEETVPDASSDVIVYQVGRIANGLDPAYYSAILAKTQDVTGTLLGSLTADLVLGGGVTEVVDSDLTLGIQKTLLTGNFSSKSSGNSVGISFGSEMEGLFGAAWSCGGDTCSGVTLKVSHYNTGVDVYTTSSSDMVAADIIEIILANPDTDAELTVTGLTTPVELTFPLTVGLSNVEYSCVAWTGSAWDTSGITTDDSGSDIVCETIHLTVFTVLGTPVTTTMMPSTEAVTTDDGSGGGGGGSNVDGTRIGIIVGAVVGGIILIIIIIVIIWCLCKAKKAKRVSPEDEEDGNRNRTTTHHHHKKGHHSEHDWEERERRDRERREQERRERERQGKTQKEWERENEHYQMDERKPLHRKSSDDSR